MKHLILILFFLGVSLSLTAQQPPPEKVKRLYFSTHLCLPTYVVYASGNGYNGSTMIFSELGYRLHRHIDLGVQVGFQRETWSGFSNIESPAVASGAFRTSWNSRRLNYFVGLQGKVNYRVGQGDLSLSGASGMVRHENLVRARSPLPFSGKLVMEPLTHPYLNLHIGYTYWASPQFGLMVGMAFFDLQNRNVNRNVEYIQGNVGRYVIREVEVEGPAVSEEDLLVLRSRIDSSSKTYLTLGLTARIY